MTELFPRLQMPDGRLALRVDNGEGHASLSYAEFSRRASGFAAHLEASGVKTAAVVARPHVDTLIAMIGAVLAKATLVPLNAKLGPKERGHILQDASPDAIFSADPADAETAIGVHDAPPRSRVLSGANTLMLYTSGTTGAPKGAVIADRQIAANIDALADAWNWTDEDVVAHALPLFHVHGLVLGAFGSLRVGGGLRLISRFSPEAVRDALDPDDSARGTMFFGVPTMHRRIADAAESDASLVASLRAARLLISGSAGLPVREHRRIESLTGRGVLERYGLTETLIVCGVRAAGGPKPGTVGPPLRGVELRVVDDEGKDVDDGVMGEVWVRGPSVFAGYHQRPDANAAAFSDGWFRTGDLARQNGDGALTIVGRRSVDLIKTGGYKVGAGEVEAALREVAGVAECAVVGEPDDDLGQRIVAHIVRGEGVELDPDALIEHVASQLTPHKRPREVRFRDSLPRNAMGKVQKKRLLP
ncbi:MAG: AMP-binding protein [Myxococcota bacterium]